MALYSPRRLSMSRRAYVLCVLSLALVGTVAVVRGQGRAGGVCQCQIPHDAPNPHPMLVGYLGVYRNLDWLSVAKTLDFTKMTHLNLAFVNPPLCGGPCTPQSS